MDEEKLLKRHEYQTKEPGLALYRPGSKEGHEQVDQKADTSTSGLCRVSLKGGRSISWPSANAGADGYKKGAGHQ